MRYWWVNQNQTCFAEIEGGYIWSPKRNSNGARNQFYDNMREVRPGDIIFSFRNTLIGAIGVATSYCYDAPKPTEFGQIGLYWEHTGWKVDILYQKLENPIHPKTHIELIRPLLPKKYSPLRETGDGLQSVYLASLPQELGRALESLIKLAGNLIVKGYEPTQSNLLSVREADVPEFDHQLEERLFASNEIGLTEKMQLAKARVGQGTFRNNVYQIERECRVTKINNPALLIASHIKPWRHSNNNERLDAQNGLMLSPDVDHLFDHGFISFAQDGQLLISPVTERSDIEKMGIIAEPNKHCGRFTNSQNDYLEFHRNNIFLTAKAV